MINGIVAGQNLYTPLQFSRSRKFTDITVSANGMTATIPSNGTYKAILGNVGKSSGKHQFEIVCDVIGGEFKAGIAAHEVGSAYNWSLGEGASALQSAGHYRGGTIYWNLAASSGFDTGMGSLSAGSVIGVTIDLTNAALPSIGLYFNGTLKKTVTAGTSAAWYPAFSAGYNTIVADAVATIRGTGLSYPVSGFTAWDAS